MKEPQKGIFKESEKNYNVLLQSKLKDKKKMKKDVKEQYKLKLEKKCKMR